MASFIKDVVVFLGLFNPLPFVIAFAIYMMSYFNEIIVFYEKVIICWFWGS